MSNSHLWKLAFAAGALAMATGAAKADVVMFAGYGALPADETVITDFASNAGLSGTYTLATGTSGSAAAPAFSASQQDPNQYLAEEGGQSATISLGGTYSIVSVYVGSLDSYNTISFSNGDSYSGGALASATGAVDDGDQWSSSSNGLMTFEFSTPVSSVTLSSSSNALEVAYVAAGVPEASTWAMMIGGFTLLAFAGYRSRARASRFAA